MFKSRLTMLACLLCILVHVRVAFLPRPNTVTEPTEPESSSDWEVLFVRIDHLKRVTVANIRHIAFSGQTDSDRQTTLPSSPHHGFRGEPRQASPHSLGLILCTLRFLYLTCRFNIFDCCLLGHRGCFADSTP